MDRSLFNVGVIILIIASFIWWWFTAKNAVSKKYILSSCICWSITVIAYIIGNSFDIPVVELIACFACLGFVYFYIKAILSERKAKKKSRYQ